MMMIPKHLLFVVLLLLSLLLLALPWLADC